jgi:hypothetical protein
MNIPVMDCLEYKLYRNCEHKDSIRTSLRWEDFSEVLVGMWIYYDYQLSPSVGWLKSDKISLL